MPYKRKSKSKSRARYGPSRHRRAVNSSRFGPKGNKKLIRSFKPYGIKPDPFPRALHTRVKYVYHGDIVSSTTLNTVGNEQAFRLTSIWDPNYTDTTGVNNTTVVGHSNFTALYDRYIVNAAKIDITWSDPDSDGSVAIVSLNQTAAIQANTIRACTEQSLTYSTQLNNTGSQRRKQTFFVTPWSLSGLSKLEWKANKTTRSAALAANPTTDIFLRLGVANARSATAMGIEVDMTITYYTTFYDRKQLSSD